MLCVYVCAYGVCHMMDCLLDNMDIRGGDILPFGGFDDIQHMPLAVVNETLSF